MNEDTDTAYGEAKEATNSYSGKLIFPRRSHKPLRIPTMSAMNDWNKILAQAIEEDKKTTIELKNYPPPVEYESSDSEEENREPTPINLSVKKSQDDNALDLRPPSRENQFSEGKNYTLPERRRLTPYRNTENKKLQGVETVAKRTLQFANEGIFEREIETHKHISFNVEPKESHQVDSGVFISSAKEKEKSATQTDGNIFAVPQIPSTSAKQSRSHGNREITVNGIPYHVLTLLGKGGSSKVFLVISKENQLLAIKRVNLADVDEKTKKDHLNEIEHLMKMQHCPHIIKIIDHQYIPSRNILYAVMERGDVDLARLLKDRTNSGGGIPPEMILFYWSEMLLAVKSIHDNNIIHRDLKPANFLLVSGRLKLIDFGIASAIQSEQTSVFKESPSGTPNYMSPEAWEVLGSGNEGMVRIGRKTDVWSLGCILYSFIYNKTPYQEYTNYLAKLRAITNPKHVINFPEVSGVPDLIIESCRRCLVFDKNKRASIDELIALKNNILCPQDPA